MTEILKINRNLSAVEIYESLIPQIINLISPDEPLISNLSNITAAIKEAFDKISWVGFYLIKDNRLFLGPFQGKIACMRIDIGKGVCGTAALQRQTIIVENVDKFPGHISCDGGSNSEIVVPLISNDKIYGVLDLDSYEFSAFNYIDQKYLEKLCFLFTQKLSFEIFVL